MRVVSERKNMFYMFYMFYMLSADQDVDEFDDM